MLNFRDNTMFYIVYNGYSIHQIYNHVYTNESRKKNSNEYP